MIHWLIIIATLYCGAMWALAIIIAVGERGPLTVVGLLQIIFAPVFIPLAILSSR
jgi:hypothetical protein